MANTFINTKTSGIATTGTQLIAPVLTGVTATIIGCSMANRSNAPITATLWILNGTTTTYLVYQATVPVGGALIAIGAEQKVVLVGGDSLVASASTAGTCDVVTSYLQVT